MAEEAPGEGEGYCSLEEQRLISLIFNHHYGEESAKYHEEVRQMFSKPTSVSEVKAMDEEHARYVKMLEGFKKPPRPVDMRLGPCVNPLSDEPERNPLFEERVKAKSAIIKERMLRKRCPGQEIPADVVTAPNPGKAESSLTLAQPDINWCAL